MEAELGEGWLRGSPHLQSVRVTQRVLPQTTSKQQRVKPVGIGGSRVEFVLLLGHVLLL